MVHLAQLYAPRPCCPPPVRFEDVESAGAVLAEGRQLRAAYLDSFARFQRSVEEACLREQVDYVLACADERPAAVLSRFLSSRSGGY